MATLLTLTHKIETALKLDRVAAEELATEFSELNRADFVTKADLRAELVALEYRLAMRGLAGLVAAMSILFAALHIWPPHP